MLLNISEISSEPLYSQILRQIRSLILSGHLEPGSLLPSIREFARNNRVSVITVQKAYDELLRDGLVVSRRGKGFYVLTIEDSEKDEILKKRCRKALEPIISESLYGGLDERSIFDIVKKICAKIKKENKHGDK